jgi:transcriptional regulator with PAS, ATPase and Fis domain
MQAVFKTISAVAATKSTVLVTGESGTGKELIARSIHYQSPRATKPLVILNCAAFAEALVESELFGHEKGAFTGAQRERAGLLESADGGTVVLDEVGETTPAIQAKLLRVLEEGEIQRVGAARSQHVDVRVVAATNRNLLDAIAEGRFRKDLYYRLHVVSVELPPLRKRTGDLPHLIRHLVQRKCEELGVPAKELAPALVDKLMAHRWPGNVRELENVIERLMVLSNGASVIGPDQLPSDLGAGAVAEPTKSAGARDAVLSGSKSLSDAVDEFERDIIGEALEQTYYNQTRAADLLGTTRRILKYRMDKLGIDCPDSAR